MGQDEGKDRQGGEEEGKDTRERKQGERKPQV